jgi:hypothetical protein
MAPIALAPEVAAEPRAYAWMAASPSTGATLTDRITPPPGFARPPMPSGSFAAWMRGLPMKAGSPPVHYFDGRRKPIDVHVAVIDIDVGKRDLQQCADAIMRLRAEWQFGSGRQQDIAFDYTGGGRVAWRRWAGGARPSEDGRRWSTRAAPDDSYRSFRTYMDSVFAFAGTKSLERELAPVTTGPIAIGDVIIKGGFPGHAVLVADMAVDTGGGRRYLLVQSYMPAQDIHVLVDPSSPDRSPWYRLDAAAQIVTPEWTFAPGSVRRWR